MLNGASESDSSFAACCSSFLPVSPSLRLLCFSSARLKLLLIALFSLTFSACNEIEKPATEPFYAQTAPPQKKEFRWSNGKMPKSFDPAMVSAPPESDIVRAIYEGLTDTDPQNLQAVPGIALEWISANDDKTWTFKLRRDAEWTNGERVTARDFVRSWKRLADLGDKVPAKSLLQNIVGMPATEMPETPVSKPDASLLIKPIDTPKIPFDGNKSEVNAANSEVKKDNNSFADTNTAETKKVGEPKIEEKNPVKQTVKFGVVAVNDYTLQVSLVKPDKDFPMLVAHPIFRPVYGDGKNFETDKLNTSIITNGAFQIASAAPDGITLKRDDDFWGSDDVELENVKFVPIETAEKALEAYKAGEIDALTNAEFEPLALKLLTPYFDFRRTTYGALNFYQINQRTQPFDDDRVRQALTIAIDRDRLSDGEMEGATEAAFGFLPFDDENAKLVQNVEKAQQLFADAGFEKGANFPAIRLVINRNATQQKIARAVAKMWKQYLNVETKIIVKDAADFEQARQTGDFDIIRRGIVLPTADEMSNMLTLFEPRKIIAKPVEKEKNVETISTVGIVKDAENGGKTNAVNSNSQISKTEKPKLENASVETLEPQDGELILNEDTAISELPAIPLYFPTSYSLVKPYIQGFEINTLDAPSLKTVRIDNNWQPPNAPDKQ